MNSNKIQCRCCGKIFGPDWIIPRHIGPWNELCPGSDQPAVTRKNNNEINNEIKELKHEFFRS